MSIIDLAQSILENEKEGLHINKIAEKAIILDKTLGSDVAAVGRKISQALGANAKKKTAIFKRLSNGKGGYKAGIYALKKKVAPKIHNPPTLDSVENPVATSYTGKAGEYGVFSELLYWGYNPAMMVVDHGVDIIASDKDGNYFHIQVKTSNPNASKSFSFKIDKQIFQLNNNNKTFYVFVVRREVKGRQLSEYVIMPSSLIQFLIDSDVITSAKDIAFNISIENGVFKINGKFDIPDVNNFSKIR